MIILSLSCGGEAKKTASTPPPKKTQVPRATPKYMQWETAPEMTIDKDKIYLATIKTVKGDVKIELLPKQAPITVNNFIFLARQKFYDNSYFHSMDSNYMAKAGKATDEVVSGPGYTIIDEITKDMVYDEPGYVAMHNRNRPNTAGSMFFINFLPLPWLDGKFTIFGKVVEGMDVLSKLKKYDSNMVQEDLQGNKLEKGDGIYTIEITEIPETMIPPKAPFIVKKPVIEPGRPLAKLAPEKREYLYNTKPEMVIDTTKSYTAVFDTTKGKITATLRVKEAPETVNNFYIVANLGFYDGLPTTSYLRSRYISYGSSRALPYVDIGYSVPMEGNPPTDKKKGILGAWFFGKLDGSSSGSIIYFMMTNDPRFDGGTVFGDLDEESMKVLGSLIAGDKINRVDFIIK